MEKTESISRAEFLKKTGIGALGLFLASKGLGSPMFTNAAVQDNIGGGTGAGVHVGKTPPDNLAMTWIDTSQDGVYKYYNKDTSSWKPARSTWYE